MLTKSLLLVWGIKKEGSFSLFSINTVCSPGGKSSPQSHHDSRGSAVRQTFWFLFSEHNFSYIPIENQVAGWWYFNVINLLVGNRKFNSQLSQWEWGQGVVYQRHYKQLWRHSTTSPFSSLHPKQHQIFRWNSALLS